MIDVNGKRIYISVPMSDRRLHNVAEFAEAHARLKCAGAAHVFNPTIGYLCQRNEVAALKDHDDYMTDCVHELTERKKRTQGWEDVIPRKYDLLVSLPGWEDSDGATTERVVAEACGIECADLEEVFA